MLNNILTLKLKLFSLIGVASIALSPNFFENCGIIHCISRPYTHQQNVAIERKHYHLVETSLALLYHASAPLHYWDDTFQTACYLINRLPTSILRNHSPFSKLSIIIY